MLFIAGSKFKVLNIHEALPHPNYPGVKGLFITVELIELLDMTNQEKLQRLEQISSLMSEIPQEKFHKIFLSEEEILNDKEYLNLRRRYRDLRLEKRVIEFSMMSDAEKYKERVDFISSQDRKRELVNIEYALYFIIYTELVEEINHFFQSSSQRSSLMPLALRLKDYLNRLAFVKINDGDLGYYIDTIKENIRDCEGADLKSMVKILSCLESVNFRAHLWQAEIY